MRKFVASMLFLYNYYMYKIPMRLMHKEFGMMIADHEVGNQEGFKMHRRRWTKWYEIVNRRQNYCDKYEAIIDGKET